MDKRQSNRLPIPVGVVVERQYVEAATRRLNPTRIYYQEMREPKVERCWAEYEADEETGAEVPAIKCDFLAPRGYYNAAAIRRGPCPDLDEPVCGAVAREDCGFVRAGEIRTTLRPEIRKEELLEGGYNHTYCARVDVYNYEEGALEGGGRPINVAHAEGGMVVNFNMWRRPNLTMEDAEEGGSAGAALGSAAGILAAVLLAAFCLARRRGRGPTDATRGDARYIGDEGGDAKATDRALANSDSDTDDDADAADEGRAKNGDVEIV